MAFEARLDVEWGDGSADAGPMLLARKQRRDMDEAAASNEGSSFASLACFRSRPPLKKKPILTVDPDELAEAHKAFELGAASLVEAEEPLAHRQVDFLGLSSMDADDHDEDMGADVIDESGAQPENNVIDPLGAGRAEIEERGHTRIEEASLELPRRKQALPPLEARERLPEVPQPIEEAEEDMTAAPRRSMAHLLRTDAEEEEDEEAPRHSVIPSIQEQLKRMRALPQPPPADEFVTQRAIAAAAPQESEPAVEDFRPTIPPQHPAEPVLRKSDPEAASAQDPLGDGCPTANPPHDEPLDLAAPGFLALPQAEAASDVEPQRQPALGDKGEDRDESDYFDPAHWNRKPPEWDRATEQDEIPDPYAWMAPPAPRRAPQGLPAQHNSLRQQLVREADEIAVETDRPSLVQSIMRALARLFGAH